MDNSFWLSLFWMIPWIVSGQVLPTTSTGPFTGKRSIVPSTAVSDPLGNFYFTNRENEVLKLDPSGKQVGYHSNNSLGPVGLIDASSPMRVLVYYPDFYTGVILDRRLLETGRFSLLSMGFGEISQVTLSRDGHIWIFDDHQQRIYKVDMAGNIMEKGNDLRLAFDERLVPSRMIDSGLALYVCVPGRGILIFDLFGQFQKAVFETEIQNFQMPDERSLAFQRGSDLIIYDLPTQKESSIGVPQHEEGSRIMVRKKDLVLVKPTGIEFLKTGDYPKHP